MEWLKRFLKPRQSNFLRLLAQQGEYAVACVDALQAYLKKPTAKNVARGRQVEKDADEIQKYFGSGFVDSLVELSPGQWHGPVLSGYGVHLVYVHNISEPPEPVFTGIRERVEQDWKTDRGEELNEKFYTNLREQ